MNSPIEELAAVAVIVIAGCAAFAAKHLHDRQKQQQRAQKHVPGPWLSQFLGGSRTVRVRSWPARARADLNRALTAVLAPPTVITWFTGLTTQHSHQTLTLAQLFDPGDYPAAKVCDPVREQVDVGNREPLNCLSGPTLWAFTENGRRIVLIFAQKQNFGRELGHQIEVAMTTAEGAEAACDALLARIESAVASGSCYRGKVISLESASGCGSGSSGVLVHRLPPIARDGLILPVTVLDQLERNVVAFARSRDELAKRGMGLRKGLLFHGPPGTGKTLAIRWLSGLLTDHTVILVTAEQVAALDEVMATARLLQPAVVVIEDVDLIARERSEMHTPGQESLLNKLLNHMDGLNEDARIIFILTTNRPEAIEPAVANRPGRIDQAVLFPLPDADCRRRLVALYGGQAQLPDAVVEEIVRRTDGASAAFIKELLRRATQSAIERQRATPQSDDLDRALEEMLTLGGQLARNLLGAGGAK